MGGRLRLHRRSHPQPGRLDIEPQFAGCHARDVEQVVDQLLLGDGRAFHHPDAVAPVSRADTLPLPSIFDHSRIVLSGVRSSWLTVEMNSSLARLACSAAAAQRFRSTQRVLEAFLRLARSVWSRMILAKPRTVPSAPGSAVSNRWPRNACRPCGCGSARPRRSPSPRPCAFRAPAAAWLRSSGVKMFAADMPNASLSVQPSSRSAPVFQLVIRPSRIGREDRVIAAFSTSRRSRSSLSRSSAPRACVRVMSQKAATHAQHRAVRAASRTGAEPTSSVLLLPVGALQLDLLVDHAFAVRKRSRKRPLVQPVRMPVRVRRPERADQVRPLRPGSGNGNARPKSAAALRLPIHELAGGRGSTRIMAAGICSIVACRRAWDAARALLGELAGGDVDERDDDAVDPVVRGAVRQRPAQVQAPAVAANLALRCGTSRCEHRLARRRPGRRSANFCARCDDGPADVGGDQVEQVATAGVYRRMRNCGSRNSTAMSVLPSRLVRSLVVCLELVHLRLELGVDGRQLLVERLHLLLAGLQLLVGALQLLVDARDLLVGGLELLVAGLQLLDRGLQLAAHQAQFVAFASSRVLSTASAGGGCRPRALAAQRSPAAKLTRTARRLCRSNVTRQYVRHAAATAAAPR